MMETREPAIFICYARADNARPGRWLDRVRESLNLLEASYGISVFADEDIPLGDLWHNRIQRQLNAAKVAVLLVSPAFLNSKYIRSSELPVLLTNAQANDTTILPVILRHSNPELAIFRYPDALAGPETRRLSDFQSLNPPDKPLASLRRPERDRYLAELVKRVYAALSRPALSDRRDLLQWTEVPNAHGERNGAMCYAYEDFHYELLRFGGDDYRRQLTDKLYRWIENKWLPMDAAGPQPHGNAAMVFDSSRRVFVLFGGWIDGNHFYGDTWEFDRNSWREVECGNQRPHCRANHTMVYHPLEKKVLMFGGSYEDKFFHDIWQYDQAGWKRLEVDFSPSARIFSRMVYDEERQVVVLFGGQRAYDVTKDDQYYCDTWFFVNGRWKLVVNEGPSPRSWHAMTYDSHRRKVILFGGGGHGRVNSFNDTWEWDGIIWTRAIDHDPSRAPAPRIGACLFFDKRTLMPILFGGHSGWRIDQTHSDTWRYTASNLEPASRRHGNG